MVVLDIASSIEGQIFLDRKGAQYQVTKDLPLPAPGFPEQLVGMKRDEEKEFKLAFPADYARPELANKEAQFKVKIIEIKLEKLPEVNAEFAELIKPEFKTVEELKKAVFDDIKMQMEERAQRVFEDKIVEKVLEISSAEFPPVMTETETDNMIRADMQRMEIDDFQQYQNTVGKTEKQLRDSLQKEAEAHVRRTLILEKIAGEEKIEVEHEEIHRQIDLMLDATEEEAQRKKLEEYFETERAHDTIGGIVLIKKTVEHLAKMAQGITEVAAKSAEDAAK
jgi:trigger factor